MEVEILPERMDGHDDTGHSPPRRASLELVQGDAHDIPDASVSRRSLGERVRAKGQRVGPGAKDQAVHFNMPLLSTRLDLLSPPIFYGEINRHDTNASPVIFILMNMHL